MSVTAIYARQSVDKKDSISIESQIDYCRKELDHEEYQIFSDKGYSGSNTNRPAFEAMMNEISEGIIQKVIVYKLDRISRSLLDFAYIMEHFDQSHVEFVSCSEKFDTSTPMGRAMLSILMVFAQLERETIQQRVTDNYYQRGKKGYYLGGKAPFGYTKVETSLNGKKTCTFEPDPGKAGVVKTIYEKYAYEGSSLGEIVQSLNQAEIKTNLNHGWTSVSISKMLRNPVYAMANAGVYRYLKRKGAQMNNEIGSYTGVHGCYTYGDRKKSTRSKFSDLSNCYVTLGLHPGIIPSELWLTCQHKLDENRQVKNFGKGSHSWLTGLMKCGYCGYAVTVVNGYKDVLYLSCSGRKMKLCYGRKRPIHVKEIESIVEQKLFDKIRMLKDQSVPDSDVQSAEIDGWKQRLADLDHKVDRLLESLLSANQHTMEYINDKILDLDREKKEIVCKMNRLLSEQGTKQKKGAEIVRLIDQWQTYPVAQKKKGGESRHFQNQHHR